MGRNQSWKRSKRSRSRKKLKGRKRSRSRSRKNLKGGKRSRKRSQSRKIKRVERKLLEGLKNDKMNIIIILMIIKNLKALKS